MWFIVLLVVVNGDKGADDNRHHGNDSRNQPAPLSQPKVADDVTGLVKDADRPRAEKSIPASENVADIMLR